MTLKKFRQQLGYQAFMLPGMLVRSLKRTHSVALAHFIKYQILCYSNAS